MLYIAQRWYWHGLCKISKTCVNWKECWLKKFCEIWVWDEFRTDIRREIRLHWTAPLEPDFFMFKRTLRNKIVAQSNIIKTKVSPGKILSYMHIMISSRSIHMYCSDWQPINSPNRTFQNNFIPPATKAAILLSHDALAKPEIFLSMDLIRSYHTITWHFERSALIIAINPKWQVRSSMVKF